MANVTKYSTKGGVRYRVRYRKPDGSQTDKRGFRRRIDAERWAAEHVTMAKAQGAFVDPQAGRITVGTLSEAWLVAKRISSKASHYRVLADAYRTWVEPTWGSVPVSEVTRESVQQWIAEITGKRSASVVLRAYGILAGILDNATADRRIHSNPARGVELPRKKPRAHRYLTVAQLISLAGEVTPWRRDIILLLGLCGMRWGELVPLRVGDVDLARHRIRIAASAPMVAGVIVPDDTKTHEARIIMYPAVLDPVLRARCVGRPSDALLFEAPGKPGEMIREWGNASRSDGWLSVGMRRAGIEGHLTIHDLRHTAASIMVCSGANVKAVQRQLGHASAAMTLDVYADLFDDDLDVLSESMGALLAQENVGKLWATVESETG